MKFKCPNCEDGTLTENEGTYECDKCDHELVSESATEMWEDGKLIAFSEELDGANDDNVIIEDESFALYGSLGNSDTFMAAVITESEYKNYKKLKEAYKKDKLTTRFVKSLTESLDKEFDNVDYDKLTAHYIDLMETADEISVDVLKIFEDVELEEEHKDEIVNIFESAVDVRINEVQKTLQKLAEKKIEKAIQTAEQETTDKIAGYVDEVVTEWYKENELAIENGLKIEQAETALNELHDVFSKYFIDVPEDRYDVVEALVEKVEKLETQLEDESAEKEALAEELAEKEKEKVLNELTEGLADTEKEELINLSETLTFDDSFEKKVLKLKEAFNKPGSAKPVKEEKEDKNEEVDNIDYDIKRAAFGL